MPFAQAHEDAGGEEVSICPQEEVSRQPQQWSRVYIALVIYKRYHGHAVPDSTRTSRGRLCDVCVCIWETYFKGVC